MVFVLENQFVQCNVYWDFVPCGFHTWYLPSLGCARCYISSQLFLWFSLKAFTFLFYVHGHFGHMFICAAHTCLVPEKARGGYRTWWNWSYRQFRATVWVLGIDGDLKKCSKYSLPLSHFSSPLKSLLHLFILCVWHSACVEARGQLVGIYSPLPLRGVWWQTHSSADLSCQTCYCYSYISVYDIDHCRRIEKTVLICWVNLFTYLRFTDTKESVKRIRYRAHPRLLHIR